MSLKSNMDRFIDKILIALTLDQLGLKSNMDRFIVFVRCKQHFSLIV